MLRAYQLREYLPQVKTKSDLSLKLLRDLEASSQFDSSLQLVNIVSMHIKNPPPVTSLVSTI